MSKAKPASDYAEVVDCQSEPSIGQMIGPKVGGSKTDLTVTADMTLDQCPTNLDLTSPVGKALAVAAMSSGDIEFDADKTARITATHFIIFPDSQADEDTGEIKEFARIVLFDAEGQTFRTTGVGGIAKMKAILTLFRPHEWAKGIPFIVKARPSKRPGRSDWHDIRVDVVKLVEMGK